MFIAPASKSPVILTRSSSPVNDLDPDIKLLQYVEGGPVYAALHTHVYVAASYKLKVIVPVRNQLACPIPSWNELVDVDPVAVGVAVPLRPYPAPT